MERLKGTSTKDYLKMLKTEENIAKAGGIKNYNKAIRKFKRHEMKITIRDAIRDLPNHFVDSIIPMIIMCLIFAFLRTKISTLENIPYVIVALAVYVFRVLRYEIGYRIRLNRGQIKIK